MTHLSINLNLLKLRNAAITTLKGKTASKRCLVIPIEDNELFVSEKGVYLGLTAFESEKLKDGKTHMVKQAMSKERREALTEDERKNLPILGDIKPLTKKIVQDSEEYTGFSDGAPLDDLPF